jgi:hypothetical protein
MIKYKEQKQEQQGKDYGEKCSYLYWKILLIILSFKRQAIGTLHD